MTEAFLTSDIITYVLAYIDRTSAALRAECDLGLLEYRILAYLSDHLEGAAPSVLARILSVTPAAITIASNALADKRLVERGMTSSSSRNLSITKEGIDAGRDADVVLASTHEHHFAPLPPHLKSTVDIGSIVTNRSSPDGMRMRDGHFFAAFETLHAFLIVERLFIQASREFGMSVTQFRILFEVDCRGGLTIPRTLADSLLLAPSSITYALNKLEANGIIRRIRSREDRRRDGVAMTNSGRDVFGKVRERFESVLMTDIRASSRRERDAYKDAAMIMATSLRKARATKA